MLQGSSRGEEAIKKLLAIGPASNSRRPQGMRRTSPLIGRLGQGQKALNLQRRARCVAHKQYSMQQQTSLSHLTNPQASGRPHPLPHHLGCRAKTADRSHFGAGNRLRTQVRAKCARLFTAFSQRSADRSADHARRLAVVRLLPQVRSSGGCHPASSSCASLSKSFVCPQANKHLQTATS